MKKIQIEKMNYPPKRKRLIGLCVSIALLCAGASTGLFIWVLTADRQAVSSFMGLTASFVGVLLVGLVAGVGALKQVQKTRQEQAARNEASGPQAMDINNIIGKEQTEKGENGQC